MKFIEKYLPMAAKPYAAEIVGGTAGYFVAQTKMFARKPTARALAIPVGMAAAEVSSEGFGSPLPKFAGLAAAYFMVVHPPRFVRKLHQKSRFSYYAVPAVSYVAGKAVAEKVL